MYLENITTTLASTIVPYDNEDLMPETTTTPNYDHFYYASLSEGLFGLCFIFGLVAFCAYATGGHGCPEC